METIETQTISQIKVRDEIYRVKLIDFFFYLHLHKTMLKYHTTETKSHFKPIIENKRLHEIQYSVI